jgi:enoyl-CoA hydratase/carnithine racemase
MTGEEVRIDLRPGPDGGRIALVTFDQERRLNCMSSPLMERFVAALETLAKDDELRCAVVTGAGDKAFVGGADLRELAALTPETARLFIRKVQRCCAAVRALPVPVIARVNGWCLGAGLELAAACDLRIASDDAMFGMPEVRVGLPSVVEAALLPRLIGWGKARELVYLAKNYTAAEAREMGLVERVVAKAGLDAAVAEWADAIARAGPRAIRLQKALVAKWEQLDLKSAVEAGVDSIASAYATDEPRRIIEPMLARMGGKP